MVKSLYDEYVTNSNIYRNVKLDYSTRSKSWGLGLGPIAMGMALDEVDYHIYCPMQALEVDKGILFDNDELDRSPFMQELFLGLAQLADGAEAHDTLCQYLCISGLVQCQLAIAQHAQHFYSNVSDKSNIFDEVKSYLEIVA